MIIQDLQRQSQIWKSIPVGQIIILDKKLVEVRQVVCDVLSQIIIILLFVCHRGFVLLVLQTERHESIVIIGQLIIVGLMMKTIILWRWMENSEIMNELSYH